MLCYEGGQALGNPDNPPLKQGDIDEILSQCDGWESEAVRRAVEYGDNMAAIETDSGKMCGHKFIAERTASGWVIRATVVWMF